jgi:hypothetical protein
MPTLGDLMRQFNADLGDKTAVVHEPSHVDAELNAALESGTTKTASAAGGTQMTLQDIYLQMMDMDKTAGLAAARGGGGGTPQEPTEAELVAAAEKLAADEAEAQLAAGGGEPGSEEILKIAAEYDAAGRIMFRGFYDEFLKEAAKLHTEAADNQHSESTSMAKTPALGDRMLPTIETNFAGSPNHDQPISTKGGKEVYRDSLATSKRIKAGVTGDDPEAAAISIGGGAPMGFATVRDLMG